MDSTDSSIETRLVISISKPWSLAIALINSISIPVYWLLEFWNTKGAKEESLAIMYLALTGMAFNPARVVVVGTAEDDEAVHFLMIYQDYHLVSF